MKLEFAVSISTDDTTGELLAVYFQIRRGKVDRTIEFADGDAFADYDARGNLLGIELLAPCSVSIVEQLAANEPAHVRRQTKKFIRETGPRHFVAA